MEIDGIFYCYDGLECDFPNHDCELCDMMHDWDYWWFKYMWQLYPENFKVFENKLWLIREIGDYKEMAFKPSFKNKEYK